MNLKASNFAIYGALFLIKLEIVFGKPNTFFGKLLLGIWFALKFYIFAS